jgi:hypothetical protein
MIFDFVLANHYEASLNSLSDLLEPIYQGLEAHGHHVIRFGIDFHQAPVLNLMVEFFPDDDFVAGLEKLKAETGPRLVVGLIAADDLEDDEALQAPPFPRRLANLRRVLSRALQRPALQRLARP